MGTMQAPILFIAKKIFTYSMELKEYIPILSFNITPFFFKKIEMESTLFFTLSQFTVLKSSDKHNFFFCKNFVLLNH